MLTGSFIVEIDSRPHILNVKRSTGSKCKSHCLSTTAVSVKLSIIVHVMTFFGREARIRSRAKRKNKSLFTFTSRSEPGFLSTVVQKYRNSNETSVAASW